MEKIIRCQCGHKACKQWRFDHLIDGLFLPSQVPDLIKELQVFEREWRASMEMAKERLHKKVEEDYDQAVGTRD